VPERGEPIGEIASLTFEPPDTDTFPCLMLAIEAGKKGAPIRPSYAPPMRSLLSFSSLGASNSPIFDQVSGADNVRA
jgi:hypothetical protein